jgi:hypothetical protein
VARYILTLADNNIHIQYRPGPQNQADALSKRPDYDHGEEDNMEVTPLPSSLFGEKAQSVALDTIIEESQTKEAKEFEHLEKTHKWEKQDGL